MATARFVRGELLIGGLFGVIEEHGVDRVNVLGSQRGGTQLLVALDEEVGGGNQVHCLADGLGVEVAVGVAELEQVFLALVGLKCEVE